MKPSWTLVRTFFTLTFVLMALLAISDWRPTAHSLLASAASSEQTPAEIHSKRLRNKEAVAFAIDDKYIYWITAPGDNKIKRIPLTGGKSVTIAASKNNQQGDGTLATYGLHQSKDWLVFNDSRWGDSSLWQVHALNLKTGEDKIVMQDHDPISLYGPDYDLDGNLLVWARNWHPSGAGCALNTLGLTDLATGETKILDEHCLSESMWVAPHIKGNKVTVEQDLPDSRGSGNNVFLFELGTGKRTQLTTDGKSSMPVLSKRWLVWKNARRYSYGKSLTIYDVKTGRESILQVPFSDPSDPSLDGKWLYWLPNLSAAKFHLYNMRQANWLDFSLPSANERYRHAQLQHGYVAWDRDPDPWSGTQHDQFLEWRKFP